MRLVAREGTMPVFSGRGGIFARPDGSRALRGDLARLGLATSMREDGHEIPITFHSLRRTFSTLLSDQGVPDVEIQLALGHNVDSTLRRHYIAKHYLDKHYEYIKRIDIG